MNAEFSPARKTRAHHRHELRTLTYLTLDNANGGVVRNLTGQGMGAQVVVAVHPKQNVKIRFELRYPKMRVETRGEVVWATFSGQCGIRFLDVTPQTSRQINEWIFGDLLEGISLHSDPDESMFAGPVRTGKSLYTAEVEDGLMVAATPVKVIELPARREEAKASMDAPAASQLDWLSQPLSARGLEWTVHALVIFAGMLLFSLVFLAVNREAPRWPLTMAAGAAFLVTGLYWLFFQVLGGTSLGARLVRLAGYGDDEEEEPRGTRFR
jgi:hypothetical protein